MDDHDTLPSGGYLETRIIAPKSQFEAQLILDDNSNTFIARYRRAKIGIVSRPRRAFLEIAPAGLGIIDLIVVTFVSFAGQHLALEANPYGGHAVGSAFAISGSSMA